jgi:hypothetical protein
MKLKTFTEEAQKELDVLQRAALVNSTFGGRKLVIEPEGQDREVATRLRGST